MPFASSASLVSTDADNMLRGLHRNNADNAHTGNTTETDLSAFTVPANTIGATGGLHIIAVGTTTGTAGIKTLRLKLGTSTISTISMAAASTNDWLFDVWVFNTATSAQRRIGRAYDGTGIDEMNYSTSAVDTTAAQVLKVTGQLANAADTVTQTMFDIFVTQIA